MKICFASVADHSHKFAAGVLAQQAEDDFLGAILATTPVSAGQVRSGSRLRTFALDGLERFEALDEARMDAGTSWADAFEQLTTATNVVAPQLSLAARDCDIFVADWVLPCAKGVAEDLGIPLVQFTTHPDAPCGNSFLRLFPPALDERAIGFPETLPDRRELPLSLKRFTDRDCLLFHFPGDCTPGKPEVFSDLYRAARMAGLPAVLVGDIPMLRPDATLYVAKTVNISALLQRVRVVVGVATPHLVAWSMSAGVPCVLLCETAEEISLAGRVEALGAGIAALESTPDTLAAFIARAAGLPKRVLKQQNTRALDAMVARATGSDV